MPMPITIPIPDWPAIFESANDFDAWIELAGSETNVQAIKYIYDEQEYDAEALEFLKDLRRTVHVLIIAEDWCPDVIRHVPVLQKMTEITDKLKVRYISRTDHPEIFARYLTAGGEAIPKMVFFNHEFIETGEWGPMPRVERRMIARGRAADNIMKAREAVFTAYFDDPSRKAATDELIDEIGIAACDLP